jgi:hypothetical protein
MKVRECRGLLVGTAGRFRVNPTNHSPEHVFSSGGEKFTRTWRDSVPGSSMDEMV